MVRRLTQALSSLALASLVACSSGDDKKAAPIGDCGNDCGQPISGSTGSGKGGAGQGGGGSSGATSGGAAGAVSAGGAAGAGVGGAVASVSVQVEVLLVGDESFTATKTYPDAALVSATGADPSAAVAKQYAGLPITLMGVIQGESWFKAAPVAASSVVLGGLVKADGEEGATIKISVVETQVMTTLFSQLPGSSGAAFDPTLSHAVISFVDKSGAPVEDVAIAPGFPALVAYDDGSGYGDTATRARGTALLLNASPVAQTMLGWAKQSTASGVVFLPLEKGFVTFVTVVVG